MNDRAVEGTRGFMFFLYYITLANSSWHWVTVSPMKILPVAIISTLSIESLSIGKSSGISNNKKTFMVVSLANLFSFLAPYLFRAYSFIPTSGRFSLSAAFNKGPFYIVLTGYLVLTLVVELPIVYILLKKEARNKLKLFVSILASNIITTLLVAFFERLICKGLW